MSYVMAAPEMMTAAATDVAAVGSTLSAAHMAAAAPTVAVIPAAADEVSASIAHLFSAHAQDYQALAGQAAAFSQQFVQHLTAGAGSYASAEAANVALLQPLTAIAGSVASASTGIQGQLGNMLTSFWNTLTGAVIGFFNALYDLAFLAYIVTYLQLILGWLVLILGILLVQFQLFQMFGITIPISLPF